MIPSTRYQGLTALVYRLGSNASTLGLPPSIRELDRRPSRPTLIARKAEEAGIMFGWAVLTMLAAVCKWGRISAGVGAGATALAEWSNFVGGSTC